MVIVTGVSGCRGQYVTTPPQNLNQFQAEYVLLGRYDVFWCPPYEYPIGRPQQEQLDAISQFTAIQANQAEFAAILDYLDVDNKSGYTDQEKLLIFRQHQRLTGALTIKASGDNYDFSLRIGEGEGQKITGMISRAGRITLTKTETSFNTCPICLAAGTLIETENVNTPVEDIVPGIKVWSQDGSGDRVLVPVMKTASTPAPAEFQAVRLMLADGRCITASPGHPTAGGRPIGDYAAGEMLDGAAVVAREYITYFGKTYDILPDSDTCLYWANGILLKSTLLR